MVIINERINPYELLGQSVKVFLKVRSSDKAAFHFKINGCGPDYLAGYDDEMNELFIALDDIDFLVITKGVL